VLTVCSTIAVLPHGFDVDGNAVVIVEDEYVGVTTAGGIGVRSTDKEFQVAKPSFFLLESPLSNLR
jgi:hypothetical protein